MPMYVSTNKTGNMNTHHDWDMEGKFVDGSFILESDGQNMAINYFNSTELDKQIYSFVDYSPSVGQVRHHRRRRRPRQSLTDDMTRWRQKRMDWFRQPPPGWSRWEDGF